MDLPTDRVPESASLAYEPILPLASGLDEEAGPLTPHQEINLRRARVENPELLRRMRSL